MHHNHGFTKERRGRLSNPEGKGFKKVKPQVIVQSAQLRRVWFIPASFLSFPEESFALSSFR